MKKELFKKWLNFMAEMSKAELNIFTNMIKTTYRLMLLVYDNKNNDIFVEDAEEEDNPFVD